MLIVEDGTGRADATAYEDRAGVIARLESFGLHQLASLPVERQESTIALATRKAEAFADRFEGSPASEGQALSWPRTGGLSTTGRTFAEDEVPESLKRAVAFLANDLARPASAVPEGVSEVKLQSGLSIKLDPSTASTFKAAYPLAWGELRSLLWT